MEIQAVSRNVRISPQKLREVVRQIQGMPALQAQAVLGMVPRKGARLVARTLATALANAEQLRAEWQPNELQSKINLLLSQAENTHNRKRKVALRRKAAQYEAFLKSANRLKPESLWVKEAHAQTAFRLKRWIPKARGSAGPILKRRAHIRITLSDE
jgi:large subunit ribosomal protein L22